MLSTTWLLDTGNHNEYNGIPGCTDPCCMRSQLKRRILHQHKNFSLPKKVRHKGNCMVKETSEKASMIPGTTLYSQILSIPPKYKKLGTCTSQVSTSCTASTEISDSTTSEERESSSSETEYKNLDVATSSTVEKTCTASEQEDEEGAFAEKEECRAPLSPCEVSSLSLIEVVPVENGDDESGCVLMPKNSYSINYIITKADACKPLNPSKMHVYALPQQCTTSHNHKEVEYLMAVEKGVIPIAVSGNSMESSSASTFTETPFVKLQHETFREAHNQSAVDIVDLLVNLVDVLKQNSRVQDENSQTENHQRKRIRQGTKSVQAEVDIKRKKRPQAPPEQTSFHNSYSPDRRPIQKRPIRRDLIGQQHRDDENKHKEDLTKSANHKEGCPLEHCEANLDTEVTDSARRTSTMSSEQSESSQSKPTSNCTATANNFLLLNRRDRLMKCLQEELKKTKLDNNDILMTFQNPGDQ